MSLLLTLNMFLLARLLSLKLLTHVQNFYTSYLRHTIINSESEALSTVNKQVFISKEEIFFLYIHFHFIKHE